MTARATETVALSKIVRIMMSVVLLVGMCASAPMQAQASESVEVTVGDDVPYAGYFTTRMWADGEVAYCAEPAAGTPAPGTYSKSDISDGDLAAAMWFSYGAPGFDESVFPERWYDGTGWSEDKYLVASHDCCRSPTRARAARRLTGPTRSSRSGPRTSSSATPGPR